MAIDTLEELLKEADEAFEAIEPIEVQVLVGSKILTARIPLMRGTDAQNALARHCYTNPMYRDPLGSWFNIPSAARDYPNVVLVDGDHEDDLLVKRGKELVYIWPEIYDRLKDEDQVTVQAAIWTLYVEEPREERERAMQRIRDHESGELARRMMDGGAM